MPSDKSAAELADLLLASDVLLKAEFERVSEPDEVAEQELRRERYIEVIRRWLDSA